MYAMFLKSESKEIENGFSFYFKLRTVSMSIFHIYNMNKYAEYMDKRMKGDFMFISDILNVCRGLLK